MKKDNLMQKYLVLMGRQAGHWPVIQPPLTIWGPKCPKLEVNPALKTARDDLKKLNMTSLLASSLQMISKATIFQHKLETS